MNCRVELLFAAAPRAAAALWSLAGSNKTYGAQHAMWTGPEISCPIVATQFPERGVFADIPPENATAFPSAGEIVTVFARQGTWKGQPPTDFFDVGLFYGDGARLLMPMGWIMGSVSGRVLSDDLNEFQSACSAIRQNGACELQFLRVQ